MEDRERQHSERQCGLADGLDRPLQERGNCGVAVLMHLDGRTSHALVEDSLTALERLDHRGARGAEENTGDGAGILIQKPHAYFADLVPDLGPPDQYGVGQFFFPNDNASIAALQQRIEAVVAEESFEKIAWRRVPTDNTGLGPAPLDTEPSVWQLLVRPQAALRPDELDVRLYMLRRMIEKEAAGCDIPRHDEFYVCSLDRQTIVYKGLLTNEQLRTYYPDLSDARVETGLALVHSRFSTNTLGAWRLAHPYRTIIHNGEINTLRGNANGMRAREAQLESAVPGLDLDKIRPVTSDAQSDTAVLDNVVELLMRSGRSLPHALRMLIPEAWNKDASLSESRRAWYAYHASLIEPWDGPALVACTDGKNVGAVLDRNGLRPCRYSVTRDRRLIMASEAGVLDLPPGDVMETGRLQPGQMFWADADEGRILSDEEVFDALTAPKYAAWLEQHQVRLTDLVSEADYETPSVQRETTGSVLQAQQRAFGYTAEHLRRLLQPMANDGKDPVGAMGDDTPPAVLSNQDHRLFNYFKQLFAQVSNPPLDYIREELVTSIECHLGRERNLLTETPEHCQRVLLESPVLRDEQLAAIETLDAPGMQSCTVDATFAPDTDLETALDTLCASAVIAVREGCEILVLSDRAAGPDRLPIPSLLAVGAVHHHLIRNELRARTSLVVSSGAAFAVHDICTLVGHGANAVHPDLAYASIRQMIGQNGDAHGPDRAIDNYVRALEDGLRKVMAKMGISTLESYQGAQVFEAVGLNQSVIDRYFTGTTSRIEGIGLDEMERAVRRRHQRAFRLPAGDGVPLDTGGELYWRRDGEFHQWNPVSIAALQRAVRTDDYGAYQQFAHHINDQSEQLQTLRGLLDVEAAEGDAIPIEEVEPAEAIVQRFFSGSMSFGSLSPEAHETLAIAMNRLGGLSGSGEGGEPVERFGTEKASMIKQIASGRFGVTGAYLQSAPHLEIKMAQGSKPGEGGHLPGEKVNELIARTRFTTPGVSLISPPPHHDIYSIEDLAQLIYDLKCANDEADIHVKLVSEAGIGVIAAGVAKARADAVLISGDSGGTGASPKTSIKSAGLPWELGLAETQQVLLENRLRSRIRVRVDGGLKTGRDVIVAALLGAEEYGFGTAPLVSLGCVMLRKCHCNTCSVGIATQDPELRKRFAGTPEHVIRYMLFVAREVREWMAKLGFRSMDAMIGRTDRLSQRPTAHEKSRHLDLSTLLWRPDTEEPLRNVTTQPDQLKNHIDHTLIEAARPALENKEPVTLEQPIRNRNRTVGTLLSAAVTKRHGAEGLDDDTIRCRFSGTAGQSFGAFLAPGITLHLTGAANDYVGKGLSGGKIVVKTPDEVSYPAHENIVIGNVALYGATQGQAYINGQAGERFAVRNSGAMAVVEGIGDHGCEYMTGGVIVVLGATGKNFGAGMSGGEAFILDEAGTFEPRVNQQMVHTEPLTAGRDQQLVRRMIENHVRYTGSTKAQDVLERWDEVVDAFVKVMPDAYARIIRQREEAGEDIRVAPPPEAREPVPSHQHSPTDIRASRRA